MVHRKFTSYLGNGKFTLEMKQDKGNNHIQKKYGMGYFPLLIGLWKFTSEKENGKCNLKIPHTGDKESLDRCG